MKMIFTGSVLHSPLSITNSAWKSSPRPRCSFWQALSALRPPPPCFFLLLRGEFRRSAHPLPVLNKYMLKSIFDGIPKALTISANECRQRQSDLSYYYLGQAAENLGYWEAAQRYYRIAERLSVGPMSCHQGEVEIQAALSIPADLCDGYSFPDALYPHLEVVEARLAALSTPTAAPDQQRTRRAVRHQVPQASTSRSAPRPGQTPTPASATGSGAAPSSGFVEPAPAAASSSTDFFEPPPVRR